MKTLLLLSLAPFLIVTRLSAQATIKKIEDPHIRAQQERMVFKRWGNFLPNPKSYWWTGGININPHYTLTWSYLAPSQNRTYRNGSDIRPLGPVGMQTQRMTLNTLLMSTSDQYKKYTDSLAKDATTELYNNSGLFSSLDPMWRIYYRKELEELLDYRLESVIGSLTDNQKIYLIKSGGITWYNDQMLLIQEKLNEAFNQDIDRGSRILNYHNILLAFRRLQANWLSKLSLADKLKGIHRHSHITKTPPKGGYSWQDGTDESIMRGIMHRIKNRIK
ncbi:hypothetical protein [Sphingobacterium siyangense]|uniref:hypothetical protein n=1 Tax=Sphingobacterium siyangense TaxID=459529 RepID=UPI0028A000C6|nr:hypothetical protein [Sphingobacterium siyangense]